MRWVDGHYARTMRIVPQLNVIAVCLRLVAPGLMWGWIPDMATIVLRLSLPDLTYRYEIYTTPRAYGSQCFNVTYLSESSRFGGSRWSIRMVQCRMSRFQNGE